MTTPFETYLQKAETDLRGGKATEHTYRGSLELLMESFERGVEASNDPKHIECGAPDFIVEKRKGRVLTSEEIGHSQVALKETIRLMKEINKAIVKWPMA